ncbi:alpha/beta hydrolase [Streptomyces sp. NPDC051907]|uniref:alpha/beta fold hydrolase n=1 Tax=Streptomyces sp. NPDC051907 TaxID=3155284 RepID=UPI003428E9FE
MRFHAYDGTELAFLLRGEGEPLIVLPGGAMRDSAYFGDLGGLDAHRRLVLLDLRGTGASEVPADPDTYRCDRQVDDVEALREHLGLERMDVLAHSASGSLAMLYAARRPERVGRLALVAPSLQAVGPAATPEEYRAAALLHTGEPWFDEAYAALDAVLSGQEPKGSPSPLFYGRWDEAAQAHAAATDKQINWEAAARYGVDEAFDAPATREALKELAAPVLVLAGEQDGGPTPKRAGELAALFPHGEVAVQPGGGHYPWLDDPEWFVGTVAGFFAR